MFTFDFPHPKIYQINDLAIGDVILPRTKEILDLIDKGQIEKCINNYSSFIYYSSLTSNHISSGCDLTKCIISENENAHLAITEEWNDINDATFLKIGNSLIDGQKLKEKEQIDIIYTITIGSYV